MNKKISIVVPCHNEEKSLPLFYEKTKEVLSGMGISYEIIFVNDGSKDETLKVIKDLAAGDDRIIYISLSRNFGKEAAMLAGLKASRGEYTAVMDADLQDPPSLIPEMLKIVEEGEYDCAATRRVSRKGEPVIRSFFARCFYKIMNAIVDFEVVDGARDFRLMSRKMTDAVISVGEYNRFSKGIFGWIGFKTKWLEYENVERVAGETNWSFFGLLKYAINGIISFSDKPLYLSSLFGIFMTFVAFIMLIVIIVKRLAFGDPVAGWASTVCIIIFVGGIQLFCIGIMGQYLAKTYMETKKRPHYIVAETNSKE